MKNKHNNEDMQKYVWDYKGRRYLMVTGKVRVYSRRKWLLRWVLKMFTRWTSERTVQASGIAWTLLEGLDKTTVEMNMGIEVYYKDKFDLKF